MPAARKRYRDDDAPAECVVRILPQLAQYLYREVVEGRYKTETELVNAIVREYVKGLPELDWKKLLKRIKEEEERENG
jgi:Arc/MetJ-type ribon-helix-helix transcriptional regulator